MTANPLFSVWDIVTIHGLQSKDGRAMNGRRGTVVGLPPGYAPCSATDAKAGAEGGQDSRVEVYLPRHNGTVAIKPGNLRKLYPGYRVGPCEKKRDSPKGLGMFATRDITAGETVLVEKPMGIQQVSDWEDLTECDQRHVAMLAGGPTHRGILNTNQFQYAGICLVLSRVNHSCASNCNYEYDTDTKQQHLYALVDIAAGEEITVSYCGDLIVSKDRRALLRSTKGFTCTCPLCSAPVLQRWTHDATIRRVKELYDFVPALTLLPGPAETAGEELYNLVSGMEPVAQTLLAPIALDMLQIHFAHLHEPTPLWEKWVRRFQAGLQMRSHTTTWEEMRETSKAWAKDLKAFARRVPSVKAAETC